MSRSINEGNIRSNSMQDANLKFSPEDLRVLQECGKESFYKRSLPFSGILGIGTYSAIKSGFLKPSVRLGATPKVAGAIILGYILGKLSYRKICAERLMELPNSEIGNMLRKRANLAPNSFSGSDYDKPIMFSPQENENKDTQSSNSSLHLDMDRPSVSLEDSFQSPSDGGFKPMSDILTPNTPSLTYDDMRRQNRDEHSLRRSQPYKVDEAARLAKLQTDQERKNQYGDVIN
ncbi:OCIA domain-containing protein asrij [Arctopsyche grandis]|uniref:OCIA domain-containing protein asrij n=1 Tax=Arctopsyche grandis TaxID=121162 RepID=UPI00406D7B56